MITLNKLRVLSESADYHDSDFIPGIGFDDLQDFDESAFTFNDLDYVDSINESIGSEIWNKIKAAFHAIRKFFVMIGTKIKNFVLGFFKKNDEELDDFIKNDLDNKSKDVADSEKIVNDIKKEAGEAIKKRHDEFAQQMKDFNSRIENDQKEHKKTAESIDRSFEDLSKMLNELDGSFSEDLNRIKNIGNYCEKVKQKNPKLAKDILDILDDKEPEIKKAAANQKKRYAGYIRLWTFSDPTILNKDDIILRSINATGYLAYGKQYSDKIKNEMLLNMFDSRFVNYVSSVISGKAVDKPVVDNEELNAIKATFDTVSKVNINKTDKNFLTHLGLRKYDSDIFGVPYIPGRPEQKDVNVKSVSDTIKIAKGINGAFKNAVKPMLDCFVNAETEINKTISKLDSYAKDPNSGEYAEVFKKHAQACNKVVGVIQFTSSAYCNAFIALSRQNTKTIKNFANGGYKKYEAF